MTEEITYVSKGWGFEKIIVNNDKYCGKILHFHKGKKCSYHYHHVKDEVFYIQSGELEIIYGYDDDISKANKRRLKVGDHFHVPVGMRHQMYAIHETQMFEFSTTDKSEDSIRVIKGD